MWPLPLAVASLRPAGAAAIDAHGAGWCGRQLRQEAAELEELPQPEDDSPVGSVRTGVARPEERQLLLSKLQPRPSPVPSPKRCGGRSARESGGTEGWLSVKRQGHLWRLFGTSVTSSGRVPGS
eukprot:1512982-Prymnesium_polylepis.2